MRKQNRSEIRNSHRRQKSFGIVAEPVCELNACHYLPKEIENIWHEKDMPEYDKTVVRVIARQQGVGGYDSWGAHCNDKYKTRQINISSKIPT